MKDELEKLREEIAELKRSSPPPSPPATRAKARAVGGESEGDMEVSIEEPVPASSSAPRAPLPLVKSSGGRALPILTTNVVVNEGSELVSVIADKV